MSDTLTQATAERPPGDAPPPLRFVSSISIVMSSPAVPGNPHRDERSPSSAPRLGASSGRGLPQASQLEGASVMCVPPLGIKRI